MAILKQQEIVKMSPNEIEDRIKNLKIELIKNRVISGKGEKTRMKEIKRTIARLLTFIRINSSDKKEK